MIIGLCGFFLLRPDAVNFAQSIVAARLHLNQSERMENRGSLDLGATARLQRQSGKGWLGRVLF